MASAEDLRFRLLRLLGEDPGLSQRDLSRRTGSSLGAVNCALRALGEAGLVRLDRFRASDDRRRYCYLLTPGGLAEKARLTGAFLERKLAEYEALRTEIDRLRSEANAASAADLRGLGGGSAGGLAGGAGVGAGGGFGGGAGGGGLGGGAGG